MTIITLCLLHVISFIILLVAREKTVLAAKSFVGGLRLAREALACEDSAKRAHETNVDDDE